MRWWLALAFALIASLTAVAVAEVFTERAEDAFRSRAEELTTGNSVAAASEVGRALRQTREGARRNPSVALEERPRHPEAEPKGRSGKGMEQTGGTHEKTHKGSFSKGLEERPRHREDEPKRRFSEGLEEELPAA